MLVRFYIDPETERPHVEEHGVRPSECIEVLEHAGHDYMGDRGARIACGKTKGGRFLKVIYPEVPEENEVFVITACPLAGHELKAYRRRLRKKGH